MFKYIVGTIIAAISWFFWIEPLFFKQESQHPSMKLFNASEENPVIKKWNETVQQLSDNSSEMSTQLLENQSLENFSLDQLSLENFSQKEVNQALKKAINIVCQQPGFSQRFETTPEQCVEQTLEYFDKCGDSLVETYKKLVTDPESMMESTGRNSCN